MRAEGVHPTLPGRPRHVRSSFSPSTFGPLRAAPVPSSPVSLCTSEPESHRGEVRLYARGALLSLSGDLPPPGPSGSLPQRF